MLQGTVEMLEAIVQHKLDLWLPRLQYSINSSHDGEGVKIRSGAGGNYETYEYSRDMVLEVTQQNTSVKPDEADDFEKMLLED